MSYIVSIDPAKCNGCRACELACSLTHTGACWPGRSRVRVVTEEANGRSESVPVLCQLCTVPACRLACPTGATFEGGPVDARLVAAEKCISCAGCVWACPFGASSLDPVTGVAQRCDLCSGEPRCVIHCPTGALTYRQDNQVGIEERRRKARILLNVQGLIQLK